MSIAKAQVKNINWLDGLGFDKTESVSMSFLDESVFKFIKNAQSIINREGKVSKGNLSDIISNVENENGIITISIGYDKKNPARKYYDFINSGVNGVELKNGGKYSYKNLKVSPEFIKSIMQWKKFNVKANKNEDQVKGKSKLQKKRQSLEDKKKSSAYAIAISIKKKGIKPILFFDKSQAKYLGNDFTKKMAKQMGIELGITIKNNFLDGNK
jgi:hypothetical protein